MSSPTITIDAAPDTEDPFDLDLRLVTTQDAAGPTAATGTLWTGCCATTRMSCSCVGCNTSTCLCTSTSCGSPPPC